MTRKPLALPLLIAITMLLLAIPNIWPYSYYQVLRWVVAATAAFAAYEAFGRGKAGWTCVLAGVAILFNPIAPIFLDKSTWIVLDLLVAGVLAVFLVAEQRVHRGPDGESMATPPPHDSAGQGSDNW